MEPAAAYVGRDTSVVVHGSAFTPAVVQELGGGTRIELDADFHASLGTYELRDVRWIDSSTLAATVPAGLPPGTYGLSLSGPYGTGAIDGAFQALDGVPAVLFESTSAPPRALVGDEIAVAVTVTNAGGKAALAVGAGAAVMAGPPAAVVAPPESTDIAAGDSHVFVWRVRATAPGLLLLNLPFAGTDEVDGSPVTAAASISIPIVTPAHLTVSSPTAPPTQPAGPPFQISVDVTNDGGSDALGVHFDPLTAPAIVSVVTSPDPRDIPAGATRTFVWTASGTNEGTATLGCSGAGTDSTGGAQVSVGPVQWMVIIFAAVAILDATPTIPPGALPNETFTVSLQLDNPGIVDALGVQPSIAVSGTGGVTLQSGPGPAKDVPAGQSMIFNWTYKAVAQGSVRFDLSAAGTDARSGNPVTVSASGTTVIGDAVPVASDPFADGAPFAFVFEYAGRVYLGPSGDGASAVRINHDGTGAQLVHFGFDTDFGNIKNAVSPTPTAFPSLGSVGCAPDTLECGPDDEDGRGLFSSVTVDGHEWLFAAGSRQSSLLKHIYLTTDTGTTPEFPFVGISPGGGTRGTSAVAGVGSVLYVGFADGGGSGTPVILKLTGLPGDSTQPVTPTITYVPTPFTLNSRRTGLIDSMVALGGWLYAANDGSSVNGNAGGCSRYNGSAWANCTPSAAAWTAKAPVMTSKTSDFVPSDKAVPQMAVSGARLYLARNTTAGPQIWGCNPSGGVCSPSDWTLIAANSSGDAQLSQMNVAGLSTISLLVATSQRVYVGYDSPGGILLYASSAQTPATVSDFAAVSKPGLGAGLTQIVDGRGIDLGGGKEFLYVAARSNSGPVAVYRSAR
ncbi:MAG TPA: hypothetical protein VEP66_05820 [Myxococcales bacterium]|nr:hypothetical protein [Myxococcales bacterium]